MNIMDFFQFSEASWLMMLGKFAVLLVVSSLLTFSGALALILINKKKHQGAGFCNWYCRCFMWGINVTIIFLGVASILIIRANGLYYFAVDSLGWSWYCGWLLMSPEILLMIGWVSVYWSLNSLIKKSVNY